MSKRIRILEHNRDEEIEHAEQLHAGKMTTVFFGHGNPLNAHRPRWLSRRVSAHINPVVKGSSDGGR